VPETNLAQEAPVTTRLYETQDQTELRSILTSTSSSALATTKLWNKFEDYLANASAALQSGARVVDIDTTTLHGPAGTALATGAWLAEGGTATASDMGVVGRTVTPARLTVYSELSNEVLKDASFPIMEAINKSMFDSLGRLLDAALYEGIHTGPPRPGGAHRTTSLRRADGCL
jgi:HK97 family phage major capsid protein